MLKGDLYNITELTYPEGTTMQVVISLDPSHNIFKGNFPQQPVLPGVCLIEILKEILIQELDISRLQEASVVKFMKLVDPTQEPTVRFDINYNSTETEVSVSATSYLTNEEANFKFKGTFSKTS